ncbi:MAG: plasmid pRiA4b ORF-3 family protein [Bryobacterales bacterium]|nr:plasmid pRiA4b ORF-3 family protein [Bryobacterales bacterium]
MKRRNIYQLRILLSRIDPPVWRRVQVWEDISLLALHKVFQRLFNWKDYHLHSFTFGKLVYELPDPEDHHFGRTPRDETGVVLNKVVGGVGTEFLYTYDFGDCWDHIVLVEGLLMPEEGAEYPRCVAGARNGPPEDAGGPFGYANYLQALANRRHPEHKEKLEWRGPFDPEEFSLHAINRALAQLQRKRRRSPKDANPS